MDRYIYTIYLYRCIYIVYINICILIYISKIKTKKNNYMSNINTFKHNIEGILCSLHSIDIDIPPIKIQCLLPLSLLNLRGLCGCFNQDNIEEMKLLLVSGPMPWWSAPQLSRETKLIGYRQIYIYRFTHTHTFQKHSHRRTQK